MKRERKEFYEELGIVVFKHKPGVKRLSIRVKPDGDIFVTLPYFVRHKHAEDFLLSKKEWIKKIQKKFESEKKKILFKDLTSYNTFKHSLRIIRQKDDKLQRKIIFPYLNIYVPFYKEIGSEECQLFIKNAITETYRKEAHEYLPVRVKYLAEIHSFEYSGLSIKKMKTRWGSCSGKNKINLNLFLMGLPLILTDYVILHELLHTKIKNHSKEFWDKLEKICPGPFSIKRLKNILS